MKHNAKGKYVRRALAFGCALASGIAMWSAYPPLYLWPAAIISPALLWASIRCLPAGGGGARAAYGLAFTGAAVFFAPHIAWTSQEAGYGPWIALVILQSLVFALIGPLWVVIARRLDSSGYAGLFYGPMLAACAWIFIEWLRSNWIFGGFPWGLIGYSQAPGPLVYIARLGGVPLVGFAVVYLGVALALSAASFTGGARAPRGLIPALAAIVLVGSLGAMRFYPVGTEGELITVAVVQGNVPKRGASWQENARGVTNNHLEATRRLLQLPTVEPGELSGNGKSTGPGGGQHAGSWPAVDLIVWPESASDIDPRQDDDIAGKLTALYRQTGVPLLLGTQRYTEKNRYNEYVLWMEGPVSAYAKQRPVAFGEYMPWRDFLRLFSEKVDLISRDMLGGEGEALIETPKPAATAVSGSALRVGTPICFEVADNAIVRRSVSAGAQLLVVPTNSATFGYGQESAQQLQISTLRAVEHGLAVTQVSTVGVSAQIDADGNVSNATGLFESGAFFAQVRLGGSITPATWMGQYIEYAMVLAGIAPALITLALGVRVRLNNKRRGVNNGRPPVSDTAA